MRINPNVAQGRVVAAARMLAGLDQAQLAAVAGLSASTISNVERGRPGIRAETLRAVRQALETLGIDLAHNRGTGHHAAATSYA